MYLNFTYTPFWFVCCKILVDHLKSLVENLSNFYSCLIKNTQTNKNH